MLNLRWVASAALALLGCVLLLIHVVYGLATLVICLYVVGHFALRSQSSPPPFRVRVVLVVLVFLCTCVVTASPWLFLGGMDGCRKLDPQMMTSYGYNFDQFWTLLQFRHALNWCLTLAAICLILAEHPPSTYIRDCIRCFLYMYVSQVDGALATTWLACAGADLDDNGIRDSLFDASFESHASLAAGMLVSSRVCSILAGIWVVRIVVKKLRALEAAFGEPLPFSAAILWLSYLLGAIVVLFMLYQISAVGLFLSCLAGAFSLVVLTALELSALHVPLRVLQLAQQKGCYEGSEQWKEKIGSAVRALQRLRLAIIVTNVSMCLNVVTMGWSLLFRSYLAATTHDYSTLLGIAGSSIGLAILSSGSLRFPLFLSSQFISGADSQIPQEPPQHSKEISRCTCGKSKQTRWSLHEDAGPLDEFFCLAFVLAVVKTGCKCCNRHRLLSCG